jgi:hypothetical protein
MIGGTEIMRELDFLKYLRQRLRSDPVPHADLRLRDGADHDLEAARLVGTREPSASKGAPHHPGSFVKEGHG